MDRERYTELLTALLSGDPAKVRWANDEFYRELVNDGANTVLVLVDAEQELSKVASR